MYSTFRRNKYCPIQVNGNLSELHLLSKHIHGIINYSTSICPFESVEAKRKNHTYVKKVEHTSEFLFTIDELEKQIIIKKTVELGQQEKN